MGPVAIKPGDNGQAGSGFHLLQELAAGIVKGQHPQIGRGVVLPAPARHIQQKLHEEAADAAGGVALAGAQLQRLSEARAGSSVLEQVLQTLAALAGVGDSVDAHKPQLVAQKLPQEGSVVARRIVEQCLAHAGGYGLLPAIITII